MALCISRHGPTCLLLFEDLALVRPTQLVLVPRVWDMISARVQSQLDRCAHDDQCPNDGQDRATVEAEVLERDRHTLLGGLSVNALTGSAPMSPELKEWTESFLEIHLLEGYGSTEAGSVIVDGQIRRPPVTDYKLVDAADLGYLTTDSPHPRGELLVKTEQLFPGYYKRPEVTAAAFDEDGFYRTGDIFAQTGPENFEYVDRRNNVLKLSQGEFITLSKLEATFDLSPVVQQIFLYGNSTRPYLLAVVVPTAEALASHDIGALKSVITESLQDTARAGGLLSYEIPRDFLIETTPFTSDNELLTGIGKLAWLKLKEHYGAALEQLYAELAAGQDEELRALRRYGANGSLLETTVRAAGALPGTAAADLQPNAHFTDLGGRLAVCPELRQPASRHFQSRRSRRRSSQPVQRPPVRRRLR